MLIPLNTKDRNAHIQSIILKEGNDSDEILKFPDTIFIYADILQSKNLNS